MVKLKRRDLKRPKSCRLHFFFFYEPPVNLNILRQLIKSACITDAECGHKGTAKRQYNFNDVEVPHQF